MKNGDIIGHALRENTIHIIGQGGFEKATTKAIVAQGIDHPDIKLNEVHIYRLFGSKELLYAEVFAVLDNELFDNLQTYLNRFYTSNEPFRERIHSFFTEIWEFLLGNEDRCRTYVRYYYSPYFCEQSLRNHTKMLNAQKKIFSPMFKQESDVISLIHTTFMTIMNFAIRVYNHEIENTPKNVYHIFNLLYDSLFSYFDPVLLAEASSRSNGKS